MAAVADAAGAAGKFVDFLRTPEAQRVFGEKGYRPVVEAVLAEFDYPKPANLFTIADLGGWAEISERFFDREAGLMAEIERGLGVPTDG